MMNSMDRKQESNRQLYRMISVFILGSAFFIHLSNASENIFDSKYIGFQIEQSNFSKMVSQADQILNKELKLNSLINKIIYLPKKSQADDIATTLKYNQTYSGIPVFAGEAILNFNTSDASLADYQSGILNENINTQATIQIDDLKKLVNDRLQDNIEYINEPKLMVLKTDDISTRLTYIMKTRTTEKAEGRELFIDANTGDVLMDISHIRDAHEQAFDNEPGSLSNRHNRGIIPNLHRRIKLVRRNNGATNTNKAPQAPEQGTAGPMRRTVYSAATPQAQANVDQYGSPLTVDFSTYKKEFENSWKGVDRNKMDRSVYNAVRNMAFTFTFYRKNFNRYSFDNTNRALLSVVHAGKNWANACWDNEHMVMLYGDGDGDFFIDTSYGLDVAAHEYTHAVTDSEAGLIYQGQSGALNESFSDFFGKMVEISVTKNANDWQIGAAIMAPAAKQKGIMALRDMMNPEKYKQPDTMNSKFLKPTSGSCNENNDMCGVHTNSGIPNRVGALIGTSIGVQKTAALFYNVLTRRLKANSNFADFKNQTQLACTQMLGQGSQDCASVDKAFQTVGL